MVVEAARQLPDVQFVLCGDGPGLRAVRRMAMGMQNVILPGWTEAPVTGTLMDWADVGLAPYASKATMSLPNKPFEYFCAGIPVVSSLTGELAELLQTHRCGVSVPPGDSAALARAIRALKENPGVREEMGCRAQRLFEAEFHTDRIYPRFVDHLVRVAREGTE